MILRSKYLSLAAIFVFGIACSSGAQDAKRYEIKIDRSKSLVSKSTPTLQVVVNPMLLRGAPMHDGSFEALHALGADYVRYVPWLPYPRQAVAELEEPKDGHTSWDFSHIDPTLEDFMKATEGHSVILNFSTIPAWMYKTAKPVTYPTDPNEVSWDYTQGTELRDPSMKEVAGYFVRLLSWYTKGGLTDEYGKWHESGHHYKVAYWELLNEIDFEHHWSPETYTRFYDATVEAMRKVDPNLKFVALAMAIPGKSPEMFAYFLNPAHHRKGIPIDFISYHFYASPGDDQTLDHWQFTFFAEEEGFLNTVRYIETIRKHYAPSVKTDLDEIGVILAEDGKENAQPGKYVAKDEPPAYWNLAGAMYADLYTQCARMGIDVIGESQLVGYKSQFPSVSMVNYKTSKPNARLLILKLLHDNFGPGDKIPDTTGGDSSLTIQAFDTKEGHKLLLINKRNRGQEVTLPSDVGSYRVSRVVTSAADSIETAEAQSRRSLKLEPFEVAVLTWK
ncbi:GH39 family glycosyl hydrolase [Terriglobus saanensis]|uniref:Glycosyl hydrolases family 39 N-terminal catalytic domain-containing protein n=1 Tax=Terriglobus saanensis (strain ATCC BAA-1853 / DSM 23119 / SP1PR4) TaxID=401053 RepID=E8V2R2_TERSS|nr:hypothetical protein [Terriglobus saanensis]ADV83537.1 hypothetical protein AciPR4_2764 [Terriglobus saanensis SP1PR4]